MKRTILAAALLCLTTAAPYMGAQQTNPSSPYEGVSNPPSDGTIETTETPIAKPPAGHPMNAQPAAPASNNIRFDAQSLPQPSGAENAGTSRNSGDADMVQGARQEGDQDPALSSRPARRTASSEIAYSNDPDGDIVHPHKLRAGELQEGATIHVRLLERLSTATSEKGESFKTRVAFDVLQDGQVLIPAGAEIDGHIAESSKGSFGGHGTLRLRPETVILPDGSHYQLHAAVTPSTGSHARVGTEGEILPNSRVKRDSMEYGGAVGAGATTGALMAGPVGALTGGLIGAGVVTAHLLVSHPQATLEPGTNLMFTLTETLSMVPARNIGS
jgi:hypothetical protein